MVSIKEAKTALAESGISSAGLEKHELMAMFEKLPKPPLSASSTGGDEDGGRDGGRAGGSRNSSHPSTRTNDSGKKSSNNSGSDNSGGFGSFGLLVLIAGIFMALRGFGSGSDRSGSAAATTAAAAAARGNGGGDVGAGGGDSDDDPCLDKFMCKAEATARERAFCLLGVGPGATPREVKSAHRKLAVLCHPDKNPQYRDLSQWLMTELNDAKELMGGGGGGTKGGSGGPGRGRGNHQQHRSNMRPAVRQQFERADRDRNGVLSTHELLAAMGGSTNRVRTVLRGADRNKDGVLDEAEFSSYFDS